MSAIEERLEKAHDALDIENAQWHDGTTTVWLPVLEDQRTLIDAMRSALRRFDNEDTGQFNDRVTGLAWAMADDLRKALA